MVYRLTKGSTLTDEEIENNFLEAEANCTIQQSATPLVVNGKITNFSPNTYYLFSSYAFANRLHRQNMSKDTTVSDITEWTTGTSLPGILAESQAIVTKNRVYLLGGYDDNSYVNTVYTALINEDGSLGAWTTGTSLPGNLGDSQAIVTKNRVYLLGGYDDNSYVNTVYTAPFADGWEILLSDYYFENLTYRESMAMPLCTQGITYSHTFDTEFHAVKLVITTSDTASSILQVSVPEAPNYSITSNSVVGSGTITFGPIYLSSKTVSYTLDTTYANQTSVILEAYYVPDA